MDKTWTEIKIIVPTEFVESAGNLANMTVPYGIYVEDYSDLEQGAREIAHIDLIAEELLKKDRTKGIIHIYLSPEDSVPEVLAFLRDRLERNGIPYETEICGCKEEDWIDNWKKYFKPIPVGKRLLIRPVWEDVFEAGDRVVLNLEPGLAFGTGTHETTRLCLELMENYLSPGMEVLDVGCGSGILSVAALLLGAKRAVGVDIDPLSVKTARENAEKNGVGEKFTAVCGNLTEGVCGKFSLVFANIVADVVIDLSKSIGEFLSEDGIFIVSGIVDMRENDVISALGNSFEILERREERGWIAMALSRRHFGGI